MTPSTLSDLARHALALAEECGFSVFVEARDGTRLILQRRHAQRSLVLILADDDRPGENREDVHTHEHA